MLPFEQKSYKINWFKQKQVSKTFKHFEIIFNKLLVIESVLNDQEFLNSSNYKTIR